MGRFVIVASLVAVIVVLGGCVPVPSSSQPPMSLEEARKIAADSECAQTGQLKEQAVYNPNSGTWWIDLAAEKPGCSPACVVDVKTKTAEVNWRCTGLKQPTSESGIAPANDAGLRNPASVNCEKQGGVLSIETGPGGGQGDCI
jgi:putative hemolysin